MPKAKYYTAIYCNEEITDSARGWTLRLKRSEHWLRVRFTEDNRSESNMCIQHIVDEALTCAIVKNKVIKRTAIGRFLYGY